MEIGHKNKPGWLGRVIDPYPWNCPGMVDVEWVFCPSGQLPRSPFRYNSTDIVNLTPQEIAEIKRSKEECQQH